MIGKLGFSFFGNEKMAATVLAIGQFWMPMLSMDNFRRKGGGRQLGRREQVTVQEDSIRAHLVIGTWEAFAR